MPFEIVHDVYTEREEKKMIIIYYYYYFLFFFLLLTFDSLPCLLITPYCVAFFIDQLRLDKVQRFYYDPSVPESVYSHHRQW